LVGNKISELPASISLLGHTLLHLNLTGNMLESADPVVSLTNLRSLILNRNRLRSLPMDIHKLEQLQYLSLSRNQLLFLPESLGRLRALNDLRVSYNKLLVLPFNSRHALLCYDHNQLYAPPWLVAAPRPRLLCRWLRLPNHPLELLPQLRQAFADPLTVMTPIRVSTGDAPPAEQRYRQPSPLLELAAAAALRILKLHSTRLYTAKQFASSHQVLRSKGICFDLAEELLDCSRRCIRCQKRYLRSDCHAVRLFAATKQYRGHLTLLPFHGRVCHALACNSDMQEWSLDLRSGQQPELDDAAPVAAVVERARQLMLLPENRFDPMQWPH
jgi:hypothetical protein